MQRIIKFTTGYSTLWGIILGIGALSFLPSAEASCAQCLAGWEWSYNSEAQNPCDIAGLLQAPCLGFPVYDLGPLGNSTSYATPQRNDTDQKKCGCNSVIYSLYAACTVCQKNQTTSGVTWMAWAQFCDSVYVTQYPFAIPFNTSVPHWAFVNYTDGTFDVVRAQAAGKGPEATPTAPPVVSLSGTTSTNGPLSTNQLSGTAASLVPAPNSTGGPNGNSKSNTGAIVGGVVGGIIGLACLVGLAFFFKRRVGGEDPGNILGSNQMAYYPTSGQRNYDQQKLYDPSDPSTFPTRPSVRNSYLGGGNYTTNPYVSGMYHGAAEL